MPEDNSNPLTDFLSALDSKGGEKGVSPPGVVKDTDGKVNPTLTSNEVTRYEKIFGIMKKVINPGPEAGKSERSSNSILKKIGSDHVPDCTRLPESEISRLRDLILITYR